MMETIKLFESYFNNSLDSSQIEEFNSRIENDREFKNDFNAYILANESLELHIRNELKILMNDWNEKKPQTKRNSPNIIRLNKQFIRIAASVLLVVGAFFIFQYYSNSIKSFDATSYIESPLRSNNNSNSELYNDAYITFMNEDYQQVIEIVNNIKSTDKDYIEALNLKGISLFRLENFEEANQIFDELLSITNNPSMKVIHDRSDWIKLNLNLEYEGLNERLIDEMLRISNDPNHLYREKSKQLYEEEYDFLYRYFGL